MTETKSYVKITLEECYIKYKQLSFGKSAQRKHRKSSEDSFEDVKSILSESNVKILPKPKDVKLATLWTKEWKRIQSQYSSMISRLHSKKFPGIFFDSRSYSVFARVIGENEAEDPSVEVISVSKSNRKRFT